MAPLELSMAGRNDIRNKAILAAFRAGTPVAELAATYALAQSTVYSVIAMEQHKRALLENPPPPPGQKPKKK